MKLIYVISKLTTTNSNYKLHLSYANTNQPYCRRHGRSFTTEVTDGRLPTCKVCLDAYNAHERDRHNILDNVGANNGQYGLVS